MRGIRVILSVLLLLAGMTAVQTESVRADEDTQSVELTANVISPFRVCTLFAFPVNKQHATVYGMLILSDDYSSLVQVDFGWSTVSHACDPEGYENWTKLKKQKKTGLFSDPLNKLEPGRIYYYRARGVSEGITIYGEERWFMVPPRSPFWWWFWGYCN